MTVSPEAKICVVCVVPSPIPRAQPRFLGSLELLGRREDGDAGGEDDGRGGGGLF